MTERGKESQQAIQPNLISDSLRPFYRDPRDLNSRWLIEKNGFSEFHGFDFTLTMVMGMRGQGLISESEVKGIIDRMRSNEHFHEFNDGAKKNGTHISEAKKNLEQVLDEEEIDSVRLHNLTRRQEYGHLTDRIKDELKKGSSVAAAIDRTCILLLPSLVNEESYDTDKRCEVVSFFPLPVPVPEEFPQTLRQYELRYIPDRLNGIGQNIAIKKAAMLIEHTRGRAIVIKGNT